MTYQRRKFNSHLAVTSPKLRSRMDSASLPKGWHKRPLYHKSKLRSLWPLFWKCQSPTEEYFKVISRSKQWPYWGQITAEYSLYGRISKVETRPQQRIYKIFVAMSRSKPGQKNGGKSRKVSISSWKQPLSSMDSKRLHMEVCNSFRERPTKVMDKFIPQHQKTRGFA